VKKSCASVAAPGNSSGGTAHLLRWKRTPGKQADGDVYLSASPVEFYSFDGPYLERLRQRDTATERHFSLYFGKLLRIKLRGKRLASTTIEDLEQETFARVFTAIRAENGQGIHHPERLGAYVNSVCNHVLQEHFRGCVRAQHDVDADTLEVPDEATDLEGDLLKEERRAAVRATLAELAERDRRILRAMFFEQRPKDDICREFEVDRGYLRVLVYRALSGFKDRYGRKDRKRLKWTAGK